MLHEQSEMAMRTWEATNQSVGISQVTGKLRLMRTKINLCLTATYLRMDLPVAVSEDSCMRQKRVCENL